MAISPILESRTFQTTERSTWQTWCCLVERATGCYAKLEPGGEISRRKLKALNLRSSPLSSWLESNSNLHLRVVPKDERRRMHHVAHHPSQHSAVIYEQRRTILQWIAYKAI